MTETLTLVHIDPPVGHEWVRRSLADGYLVSKAVMALDPLTRGSFSVIAPEWLQIPRPESLGLAHQIPQHVDALNVLVATLDAWIAKGAACLVVENNISSRMDPHGRFGHRSYLEDTVVNWLDLPEASGEMALNVIGTSSTDWMLNAFVSKESSEALGLVHCRDAPARLGTRIAQSLMGMVVSAFDGESYVVWTDE